MQHLRSIVVHLHGGVWDEPGGCKPCSRTHGAQWVAGGAAGQPLQEQQRGWRLCAIRSLVLEGTLATAGAPQSPESFLTLPGAARDEPV